MEAAAGGQYLVAVDLATLTVQVKIPDFSLDPMVLGVGKTVFAHRINASSPSSPGWLTSINLTDGSTIWETPVPVQLNLCPDMDFEMVLGGPWLALYCPDGSFSLDITALRGKRTAVGTGAGNYKPSDPVLVVVNAQTGAVLASNQFNGYRDIVLPMCAMSAQTSARDLSILNNPCAY